MYRSRRARHTAPGVATVAAAVADGLLASPTPAAMAAAQVIASVATVTTDDTTVATPPAAAAAAATAATASVPTMALAGLSCNGDFSATVAAIRVHESAARLHSFADECQQQEGVVRTPLVLLQVLALMRQFECSSPLTAGAARATDASDDAFQAFGRGLEAHGQTACQHVRPQAVI